MNNLIISKAPFRVSLAGGGTDIKAYCSQFGGKVIGFSIDKYVITTFVPKKFNNVNEITGNQNEKFSSYFEVKNKYLSQAIKVLDIKNNFNASIISDAPPCTGLGGSASFLNSFILAGKKSAGVELSKIDLAKISSNIEIMNLHRSVGRQDHYLSSLGGMNFLEFDNNLETSVSNIFLKEKCINYINERLLLFYTNITRSAGKTLNDQSQKIEQADKDTIQLLHDIKSLVSSMYDALINDTPDIIGPILKEHWAKKTLLSSENNNNYINDLIELAYKNGADGCKTLGAGGGGFILISAKEGMHSKIRNVFLDYKIKELEFNIDFKGTVANNIIF